MWLLRIIGAMPLVAILFLSASWEPVSMAHATRRVPRESSVTTSATAQAVPGASYTGTHSERRPVSLTIAGDGQSVASFRFESVDRSSCPSAVSLSYSGTGSITGGESSFSVPGGVAVDAGGISVNVRQAGVLLDGVTPHVTIRGEFQSDGSIKGTLDYGVIVRDPVAAATAIHPLLALTACTGNLIWSAATAAPVPPPAPPPATPVSEVSISIADFEFQPALVRAPGGASIVWINTGQESHAVRSVDGLWDSGAIEPGQQYGLVLDAPGAYEYQCPIHPDMRASVIIE